jgi:hypothetical protein
MMVIAYSVGRRPRDSDTGHQQNKMRNLGNAGQQQDRSEPLHNEPHQVRQEQDFSARR